MASMTDRTAVLILGEVTKGRLSASTRELIGGGRDLADTLRSKLTLAVLGDDLKATGEEAIACGADVVLLAENPSLREYQADAYLQILERAVDHINPEILLMGHTSLGRDFAPRLAYRLKTGLSMDCVELSIDPGSGLLRMTRPVYGCKALSVMVCRTKPQMATARLGAMRPLDPDATRSGRVAAIDADIDRSLIRAQVIERVDPYEEGVALEDARVIVCGGRGMGSGESFGLLEELAQLLGGAVGASRPPCDSGWVPSTRQIGLTGKILRPDLYIAVAISGSSQHMAGCSDSRRIVAINKDPQANIFSVAHYGVVGDYREIVPPFMQRVKQILGVRERDDDT